MDFSIGYARFRSAWPTARTPSINVRGFMDLDLDIVGAYAIGHHAFETFLAAVRQFEPLLVAQPDKLRHSWAEINGTEFKEVYSWQVGAQPITLIELYND
ncbi:MAG TPA: hypothetical protein V6D06_01190 [Trichocoleus sp.]